MFEQCCRCTVRSSVEFASVNCCLKLVYRCDVMRQHRYLKIISQQYQTLNFAIFACISFTVIRLWVLSLQLNTALRLRYENKAAIKRNKIFCLFFFSLIFITTRFGRKWPTSGSTKCKNTWRLISAVQITLFVWTDDGHFRPQYCVKNHKFSK